MALHQGESTEAFEWFKVSSAVGNVSHYGVLQSEHKPKSPLLADTTRTHNSTP